MADSAWIPGKKVADSTGFRGKKVANTKKTGSRIPPRFCKKNYIKKLVPQIPRIPRLQKSPRLQKLDYTGPGLLPKTIFFLNKQREKTLMGNKITQKDTSVFTS